jgi:carbamoyltransferase
LAEKYGAEIKQCDDAEIVDLLTSKNIVAIFQGRSESGPRALGNRSLLFDPRFKDGKDFVNGVKRREYFRPFAGSILEEDTHEWFDLRGMDDSPHMMYAVSCKPGVADKIPSIIHVDGSCRIQTVNEEQNPLYYRLIKKFKEETGFPIVFNTSFNLGGEPLVETLEDAFWTLQQSKIEYLYLPEYQKLISIIN